MYGNRRAVSRTFLADNLVKVARRLDSIETEKAVGGSKKHRHSAAGRQMASRRLSRAAAAGDVGAVDALLREGADPGFQVRPRLALGRASPLSRRAARTAARSRVARAHASVGGGARRDRR